MPRPALISPPRGASILARPRRARHQGGSLGRRQAQASADSSSAASRSTTCLILPVPAKALDRAFVVSLEVRESEVTRAADVVLPVAPVVEKAGTLASRAGVVCRSVPGRAQRTWRHGSTDIRVLAGIAEEMESELGL